MPRPQVDTRITDIELQPQARPVDTYVQPARPALLDFAEKLGKIDRSLGAFLDARAAKQAKDDELRGQAAWYADNAPDLADGVRDGRIPPQYSPAFVKGWKNAQGNVAGGQLQQAFDAAYEAWDGKNSEDPSAYDTFVQGFLKDHISETEDPEVLRGLLPHIDQLESNGRARYTEYRAKQTYKGSLDAHVAGAMQDVDQLDSEGKTVPEGTNYPEVFKRIEQKRSDFINNGGSPDDFDKSMIDAMSIKVLSTRDPGLLAFFDQKVPGKDYTYGDSPYGQKVKQETISSLEVIGRTMTAEEARRQTQADKEAKDAATRNTIEFLAANPAAPIPDGMLTAGTKADPLYRVHVEEWRKNLSAGFTDPNKIKDVYAEVLTGKGTQAVIEAFQQGVFGKPEDFTAAMAFAKSFDDNKDLIKTVLGGGVASQILKDLDIRTKGKNDFTGDPISGMSNEGYEATYDFRLAVENWVINHPSAGQQEVDEAVTKIGKSIMDRLVLPEGGDSEFDAKTYERDPNNPDLQFTNPYTSGTTPTLDGERPQQPDAPSPDDKADAEDLLNGLTPEQKTAVEGRAKAMGLSTDEFVQKYMLQVPQPGGNAPDGTPATKSNYAPEDANGGNAASAALDQLVTAKPTGMAALVTSNKRGYVPDTEHLKPAVVRGVTALQQAFGKELPIVSGFRDERRNKKAGGARKSQHIHGNAVDIDVSGMDRTERLRLIQMASRQGFTGIGVYPNSIHLDYGGRRAWGPNFSRTSLPGWAKAAINEHMGRTDAPMVATGESPAFDTKTAMGFLDEALAGDGVDVGYPGSADLGGDHTASRLANLIVQHEAGGNWNAIAGNPQSTRDLGKLTLNQILATQVAAKRRGVESTAVGGPQFLLGTLRGLKKELGLTGNEKFDQKLQERLLMALLNRRGYQLFKAGKISKRQFAFRLSQEWAAVANPYTGQSYYQGVGSNRASVRPAQVYAALGI